MSNQPTDQLANALRLAQLNIGCRFIQFGFILRCAVLPTAAAPMLVSWFYLRITLFSFEILSPLMPKGTICSTCVTASVRGLVSTLLEERPLMSDSFAYPKTSMYSKQPARQHNDAMTEWHICFSQVDN